MSKEKHPPAALAGIVHRLEAAGSWVDLALQPGAQTQLEAVSRWLRERRALGRAAAPPVGAKRGHRVLLLGPSGTGKTLAAALLGTATGQEVYRIDLAAVVSGYIGETEKNLDRLFETAQRRDWILFFDEADALFGKRSEVKDAHDRYAVKDTHDRYAVKDTHDRYANQEVSCLLQRIEDYAGLVVLATALRADIDQAVRGRFDAVVCFAPPVKCGHRP